MCRPLPIPGDFTLPLDTSFGTDGEVQVDFGGDHVNEAFNVRAPAGMGRSW